MPSVFQGPPPQYSYGSLVSLYENTDFLKFLAAIAAGHIVYDPALKLEDASSARPKLKRRSQFRISQPSLSVLYDDGGHVDVMSAA